MYIHIYIYISLTKNLILICQKWMHGMDLCESHAWLLNLHFSIQLANRCQNYDRFSDRIYADCFCLL